MAVITYKGRIAPFVMFKYKGGVVANAKTTNTTKDYSYPLVNDNVVEFTITGKAGSKKYKLKAKKSKKNKIFDAKTLSFSPRTIRGKNLNTLLDSNASGIR